MNRIGVVDFSHALRVHYHSQSKDSGPNDAGQRTLDQLSGWRQSVDHLIVALDSPPYFRKQIHPEYKASRERDDAYSHICRWTKERLVADGYSIASAPGFEADDVLATLALALAQRANEVRLITNDKDVLQCVTGFEKGVRVFAPTPGGDFEIRDHRWVAEKYGVTPGQMALLQAIAGDGSDDIPGIMGIGAKGAAKLITAHGTIIKMRVAAVKALEESQQPGAKALSAGWRKFLDGSPNLEKWLQLTTLRTDVPLDIEALLVRQPMRKLVDDRISPEDIENGDAWEPSSEELEEERKILDPTEVISGPPQAPGPTPAAASDATEPLPSLQTNAALKSGSDKSTQSSKPRAATVEKPPEVTGELVVRAPAPSWALQLQPGSAREAEIIAAKLYNSRHYMQWDHAPGILSIILKGRELGLGMMAALEMFYPVKGRPYPSAKAKRYLASRDPDCEWIMVTSADDKHATVKTKHRKAGILEYTYTIERAQKAGFLTGGNKHNWLTITQEMLEARASSKGADRWYPGSTFGMPSAEEMQDRDGLEENYND